MNRLGPLLDRLLNLLTNDGAQSCGQISNRGSISQVWRLGKVDTPRLLDLTKRRSRHTATALDGSQSLTANAAHLGKPLLSKIATVPELTDPFTCRLTHV